MVQCRFPFSRLHPFVGQLSVSCFEECICDTTVAAYVSASVRSIGRCLIARRAHIEDNLIILIKLGITLLPAYIGLICRRVGRLYFASQTR